MPRVEAKSNSGRNSTTENVRTSAGIELARKLTKPIEDAVLSGNPLSDASVTDFVNVWSRHLREGVHWRAESAADSLVRTVGLGCACIVLNHASNISADRAKTLIGLISAGRFFVPEKIEVLALLVKRPVLHELAGEFARHVAEQIRQDDNIGRRGDSYVKLAASLVPMSIDEAREYYRQGLAELDQIGGESYEQIYSLLHFASAQQGGF